MSEAITFLNNLLQMQMARPNDFGNGHIEIHADQRDVDLNITLRLDDLNTLLRSRPSAMDEGLYCMLRELITEANIKNELKERLRAALKVVEP